MVTEGSPPVASRAAPRPGELVSAPVYEPATIRGSITPEERMLPSNNVRTAPVEVTRIPNMMKRTPYCLITLTISSDARSPTATTNITRFQVKYSYGTEKPVTPRANPVKRVPDVPRAIPLNRILPMTRPDATARLIKKISFSKRTWKYSKHLTSFILNPE